MLPNKEDRNAWLMALAVVLSVLVVLLGIVIFLGTIMCKAEAHDVVTLSKDAQVINSTSANLIKRATNNDCSDLYEKLTSLYDVAVNYVNHNNRTEGEMILGSQGTAALIYIMALTNNFKVCEEQASKFLWEKGHRILQLSGENYNSRKETIFSYRRLSNVKTK